MRGLAASVACQGLPVVTFDLRGVGSSTGRSTFTGAHEVKDVEAVCQWVHQSLDLRVLLVGSSAGAAPLPLASTRPAGASLHQSARRHSHASKLLASCPACYECDQRRMHHFRSELCINLTSAAQVRVQVLQSLAAQSHAPLQSSRLSRSATSLVGGPAGSLAATTTPC